MLVLLDFSWSFACFVLVSYRFYAGFLPVLHFCLLFLCQFCLEFNSILFWFYTGCALVFVLSCVSDLCNQTGSRSRHALPLGIVTGV